MPYLTLNRVFAASIIGLFAGLGLLFWNVFSGLQNALLSSAAHARDRDSAVIAQSVNDYLDHAPGAVSKFETLLAAGLVNPSDPRSLRDALFTLLLHNADISEATFTFARSPGFGPNGKRLIDPASVGQVSIFHAINGPGFVHRNTWFQAGGFLSTDFQLARDGREIQRVPQAAAANPSLHPTFTTPSLHDFYGQLLWTDLHWFALDQAKPELRRRVEVGVIKAIESPPGQFVGVIRIGLFKGAIDGAIKNPVAVDTSTHSIFLCDSQGRLIALSGSSRYVVSGDDLRVSAADASPQVIAALRVPALAAVDASTHPLASGDFITSGTNFLYTFRSITEGRDWIVGMVVPQQVYLADLLKIRNKVFWGSLALATVIAFFGLIVLYAVSVAHAVILREAALMNDFVLTPAQHSCNFRDIDRVLASLERAKTAMRSMGKYVPMDLVRRLYHRGEEPTLGGETTELSVLFTDIQSFTGFAESHDPDTVAIRLGAYLEVLASVIQRENGTIDKYIGDSVMAFWNAPEPVPSHAALACRAALAGREALALLYQSPAWGGVPAFGTRFGLHHCIASVGHFGSPDRFNYTAIGDGINLASRLQSLNKYYGTTIIGSALIRDTAGPGFLWRHLDRVAVKGKTQGIDIYELIAESSAPLPAPLAAYEQALDAYFERDFKRALSIAGSQASADPPSALLATRCRHYLIEPPPPDWTGVYAFDTK